MREQVCNKKDLKNTLWQEIVGLVKRRDDLQTDEVPDNKSSGTARNSEDNDKWVLDETDRIIKRELPHLDDAERFAHKIVCRRGFGAEICHEVIEGKCVQFAKCRTKRREGLSYFSSFRVVAIGMFECIMLYNKERLLERIVLTLLLCHDC